jgi:hypothetical protein
MDVPIIGMSRKGTKIRRMETGVIEAETEARWRKRCEAVRFKVMPSRRPGFVSFLFPLSSFSRPAPDETDVTRL